MSHNVVCYLVRFIGLHGFFTEQKRAEIEILTDKYYETRVGTKERQRITTYIANVMRISTLYNRTMDIPEGVTVWEIDYTDFFSV